MDTSHNSGGDVSSSLDAGHTRRARALHGIMRATQAASASQGLVVTIALPWTRDTLAALVPCTASCGRHKRRVTANAKLTGQPFFRQQETSPCIRGKQSRKWSPDTVAPCIRGKQSRKWSPDTVEKIRTRLGAVNGDVTAAFLFNVRAVVAKVNNNPVKNECLESGLFQPLNTLTPRK